MGGCKLRILLLTIFISVKGMKTEFATPKDLEKLRWAFQVSSTLEIVIFSSRAELSKGGMGLDPNDATMGPIMDSLIMTSKKRYVKLNLV